MNIMPFLLFHSSFVTQYFYFAEYSIHIFMEVIIIIINHFRQYFPFFIATIRYIYHHIVLLHSIFTFNRQINIFNDVNVLYLLFFSILLGNYIGTLLSHALKLCRHYVRNFL